MKHFIMPASMVFLIAITGCYGEKTVTNPDLKDAIRVSNLTYYLNTQPRIKVMGQGRNAIIHSAPLLILDDIQIGHDFRDMYNLLDQNEYVTIKILTMRKATILYGEEGSNGAILISRVEKSQSQY